MCASEIRVKRIRVNQGLGVFKKIVRLIYLPGKKGILQYLFFKLHNLFSHYLARFHSIFLTFVTLLGLEAAEGKHH